MQSKNQQRTGGPQEVRYNGRCEQTNIPEGYGMQTVHYVSVPRDKYAAFHGETQHVVPMMQRWLTEGRQEQVWDNVGEVAISDTAGKHT